MSGRDAWIEKVREKDAEIDMLRKALGLAGERINTQDAEIERLKKVADQAIRILKYKDPELLDEMKEYGDINFSDFADYLKEKENGTEKH